MKKIKKECMKNMIAGPSLIDQNQSLKVHKQSNSYQKDSMISNKSAHKNSLVGPAYNSDTEDNKQSEEFIMKEEVNREAKHWHNTFHRQSSHDQLNDL